MSDARAGPDIKNIIESVLFGVGRPMKIDELLALFGDSGMSIDREKIRQALNDLSEDLESRGVELNEVASGFRIQVRTDYSPWLARALTERPTRYSRALLETLVLIAYRQPVTRGEIEDVRGVSVSASIVKTLQEREWVRVLGHRDVPGRPALYGTTRQFLDDFNLRGLEDLPPLAEVRDIDRFHVDLFAEQSEQTKEGKASGDNDQPLPEAHDSLPDSDGAIEPVGGADTATVESAAASFSEETASLPEPSEHGAADAHDRPGRLERKVPNDPAGNDGAMGSTPSAETEVGLTVPSPDDLSESDVPEPGPDSDVKLASGSDAEAQSGAPSGHTEAPE